jgi:hypothetical protein
MTVASGFTLTEASRARSELDKLFDLVLSARILLASGDSNVLLRLEAVKESANRAILILSGVDVNDDAQKQQSPGRS